MSSKITELDPITIQKIAAGEVIERPVSMVKELIENALDAKATHIRIVCQDAGKKRLTITDNGTGISKEDLPLAPKPHSTSKISVLEDLYQTHTFGFRGEALGSICHVAKMTIKSKVADQDAYEVHAYQDQISDPKLCAHPVGTTIDIKDLFFDLPVRAQFLRTNGTELSYITQTVTQLALIHPSVDFQLINNDKEVINTCGVSDLSQLIPLFYGTDISLLPIDTTVGPLTVTGMISDPQTTFSNKSKQTLSINGRLVQSQLIYKAITQSYKDDIPARRFPLTVLNLRLATQRLDVNIHPQKLDIKFLDPSLVFDALHKALRFQLQGTAQPPISNSNLPPYSAPSTPAMMTPSHDHTPSVSSPPAAPKPPESTLTNATLSATPASHLSFSSPATPDDVPARMVAPVAEKIPSMTDIAPLYSPQLTQNSIEYFQLYQTYIGIPSSDGLWLLDQHAVHERILYEKIKTQFGQNKDRQVLLVADIIPLPADLMCLVDEHLETLAALNFVLEPYGPNDIALREVPLTFTDCQLSQLLLDLLKTLKDYPNATQDLTLSQKESLQMKACKAAIKAGQTLYPEEVSQLVKDFLNCPSNYTCPHGRPLYIHMNRSKLERLFNRS